MFTGLTQDILTEMWDTPNRELSSVGRWLSPDPAGSGWNQYAYSTDPNSHTDPSGLQSGQNNGCNGNYFCNLFESGGNSLYGDFVGGFITSAQFPQGVVPFTSNSPNAVPVINGVPAFTLQNGNISFGNCSFGCVTTASIDTLNGKVVGGSASDAATLGSLAASMFSFGELTTAQIAVIGRLADTEVWALRGYKVFQMTGTLDQVAEANAAWVQEVIVNGEPVIVASDLTYANVVGSGTGLLEEGVTSFGGELGSFIEAGYEMVTVEEAGEVLLVLALF
jgi:RHS repeat-associated protein